MLLLVLLSGISLISQAAPLKLIDVSLINSDYPLEPSGLANCGDKILLVSDKFDEVFWLKPGVGESRADVYFHISAPYLPMPQFQHMKDEFKQKLREMVTKFTFDWEAISCDDKGHVFLGSERNTNVLQLTAPSPAEMNTTVNGQWVLNGFDEYAKQKHFFEIFNAGMESMTWYKEGFIVAAERRPRGLFNIIVDAQGKWQVKNMAEIPANGLPPVVKDAKKPDFADVYVENDKIYTLERYAAAVCRRDLNSFAQEKCWTYADVENDPKWIYRNHKFGVAEGLTRFGNRILITTDNNLETREAAPNDARPELYQFEVPADWRE
ncbi:MAG TPA: hypothetical protein VFM46_02840 [Pseudomonadales bacterium]|nr:hypothetical protein [Pseudomonadales bacterium]